MAHALKTITRLQAATTSELLAELRRRSLGCMLIVVGVEADNTDKWSCALKGSSILLGAMSAALSMRTKQMLTGSEDSEPAPAE